VLVFQSPDATVEAGVFSAVRHPVTASRPPRVSTAPRTRDMRTIHDAAYTMAAVSATVALFRALVKKGVLTRDEAVRALLDEAVARAIQAEASADGQATNEINSQSAEILKFIAEKL
jgi:polyhydroxyalkanoate synthesis regulator phasin